MKHIEFYEKLEADLEPFSDAEVDAISSAAEFDWRYRIEVWCIISASAITPLATGFLGFHAIRSYDLSALAKIVAGLLLVACIFGSVRLVIALANLVVAWRCRESFQRQLKNFRRTSGL